MGETSLSPARALILFRISSNATIHQNHIDNSIFNPYYYKMKRYLNASDVARILKVDRATIIRWIKSNLIKGEQKPSGRREWVISISDFEQFIKTKDESRNV